MNPIAELMDAVWAGFEKSSRRFPLAPVRGRFVKAGLAIWAIMGAPIVESRLQGAPTTERPPEANVTDGFSEDEQAASWERALARARDLGWDLNRMLAVASGNVADASRHEFSSEMLPEKLFEDEEG